MSGRSSKAKAAAFAVVMSASAAGPVSADTPKWGLYVQVIEALRAGDTATLNRLHQSNKLDGMAAAIAAAAVSGAPIWSLSSQVSRCCSGSGGDTDMSDLDSLFGAGVCGAETVAAGPSAEFCKIEQASLIPAKPVIS